MTKYDDRVFLVFKKLAGKKFKEVLETAKGFELAGKNPERALGDALEAFGLGGAADVK